MNESAIIAATIKALKARFPGIYVRKLSDRRTAGLPDLICCWQGGFYGLECKVPGEDYRPLQRLEADAIIKANGIAGVFHSPADAIDLVRRWTL